MSLANVLKRFSGSPTKWLREPQGTVATRIKAGGSLCSLCSPAKNNIPSANDEIRPGIGLLELADSNPLPEHQLEAVAMLRADSALRYAFVTRQEGENIIVSLAVRDVAVCDLTIPASNYDPMAFWKTINEVTHD